jgi:hypothetical protein
MPLRFHRNRRVRQNPQIGCCNEFSLDGIAQKPENGSVLKKAMTLLILGFVLIGLFGQTANAQPCSSSDMSAGGQMAMSGCEQMNIENQPNQTNQSDGCCPDGCIAMAQCSPSNAMFEAKPPLMNWFPVKAERRIAAVQLAPRGEQHTPITKPPISA